MLSTTRAVILRTVKHSDHGVVAHVYTELFGKRSCMVRAGGRNRDRQAALLPLSRVELVVVDPGEGDLLSVREMRIDRPYQRLHTEPLRGALALFTQEVLYRALRADTADDELFAFVQDALEELDSGEGTALFPHHLLIGLAHQLGFLPQIPSDRPDGFDMRDGCYFKGAPAHDLCMDADQTTAMISLMSEGDGATPPSSTLRRTLLERMLLFYRLHIEGFGELRSLPVLQQVLH